MTGQELGPGIRSFGNYRTRVSRRADSEAAGHRAYAGWSFHEEQLRRDLRVISIRVTCDPEIRTEHWTSNDTI